MLPQDPVMLLSFVNMKLRDNYSDLDDMCDALDIDKEELVEKLEKAGYKYDAENHCFK
ncbi:MAG: DUF4250 domain-containing protein [Lachnospiraceae bacterium]|nr:DUF4250 domain-containing protein [Lachnospiraceae bacterium]